MAEPKKTPVPKEALDRFCSHFSCMKDVSLSQEWTDIYSIYFDFDKYELDVRTDETEDDLNAYDSEKQVNEIIKCVNSFPYFCHKYVKITHPIRGLIPLRLFKYQRRVIREYEKHRFNILSKFRQGGLTTISVIWALWKCLFQTDQQVMVLSKTDREAITAGEIARSAMLHLPKWMLPKMGKNNEHERQFVETGSNLWFFTPEAARGKSITILIVDEAAFIPDMDKHWKAMYPVIATGGSCIIVSTVNGIGNWYEKTYNNAKRKKGPFNLIELDYWEHPEYNDPKWISDTRSNLGEKGWQQEVLRSFLGSGETFIPPNILDELDQHTKDNRPLRILFNKWTNKYKDRDRSEEWEEGALWVWKEPIDGHEYVIGADCSEGVGEDGDNSAFEVLDAATLEQVAEFYSNNIPPHIYAEILNQIGIYYNHALLVVENMNQGSAVLSKLQHTLAYENLYFEPKGKQETAGIKTGKQNRPQYLETLQNRLLNGAVRINSSRFVDELKTFVFNSYSKKAEALRGSHDDTVLAMSMGLFIRDTQMRSIPPGAEVPEELVKAYKTDIYEEIRQEILRGAPEDWIEEPKDYIASIEEDDIMTGVSFNLKRKNDALLKEFSWIFIVAALINLI